MPARYVFAAAMLVAFYGIGYVPEDSPLYTLLGVTLVLGVMALCYGLLHPVRRR